MQENNKKYDFILTEEQEEELKREREEKAKIFQEKKQKYSAFFNDETGIEFLKELKERSGILRQRALFYNSQNSVDISKISFADGYREMFLEILGFLNNEIINKVLDYDRK